MGDFKSCGTNMLLVVKSYQRFVNNEKMQSFATLIACATKIVKSLPIIWITQILKEKPAEMKM
jgi:hypothetical protein